MSEANVESGSAAGKAASDRNLVERLTLSASALVVTAIVLMLNYLAFRHYQRFDWTSQGLYTLSPKSKTVLRELNKDIDLYVFMSRGEGSFGSTDELLKRYAAASQHVKLHYVDPDREASEFKLLAQRFGIAAPVIETGEARADVAAVVALGDKNWHIPRDALSSSDFPMPGDAGGGEEVRVQAEQAVTGAIVQVTSGRATKLCATTGHGEWSVEEGGGERALSSLKRGLRHDNIEWQSFETLGQKSVPAGCDAVIVAGPLRALSEPEAKLLFEYGRGGGNLLLLLDPVLERDQVASTGFESLLREAGIRLDLAVVLELSPDRLLTRNPAEFVVTEFGDHVTTRPLQHAARMFLSLARSITPISQEGTVEILLRTSDKAFGKTVISEITPDAEPKRGPSDIEGPITLAVATSLITKEAGQEKKPGGRLIVIGDSDFIQDPLLESPELANFHVASAFIGWLAERPALIDIPPKKIKSGNIVFTQEDLWALLFRVAFLLPGAAVVLGVAVWLNRKA
jgi:ABC-2 type transport system permease protein